MPTDPAHRLGTEEELLHRQVPPMWIDQGKVSSQAFFPSTKDAGLLSVSRASVTTTEEAYRLCVKVKGLASAGVWSVSVGECDDLSLPSYEHPDVQPVPDPAHSLIDFNGHTRSQQNRRSQKLRNHAEARGCQHSPTASP